MNGLTWISKELVKPIGARHLETHYIYYLLHINKCIFVTSTALFIVIRQHLWFIIMNIEIIVTINSMIRCIYTHTTSDEHYKALHTSVGVLRRECILIFGFTHRVSLYSIYQSFKVIYVLLELNVKIQRWTLFQYCIVHKLGFFTECFL